MALTRDDWIAATYQALGWADDAAQNQPAPDANTVRAELQAIADPRDALPVELVGVRAARQAVLDLLTADATPTMIAQARGRIAQVRTAVAAAADQVRARLTDRQILLDLEFRDDKLTLPKTAPAPDLVRITERRAEIRTILRGELTSANLDLASVKITQLELDLKEVVALEEENQKDLADVGDKDKVKELMHKFGVANVKKLTSDLGGAKRTAALVKEFTPDQIEDLMDSFGSGTKVKEFVTDACGGEATELKKMTVAFPKGKDLVTFVDTSLQGRGKVLGQLLKTGCGGDGAKLKDTLAAFNKDFSSLTNLVAGAGLAEQVDDPEGTGKKVDKLSPDCLGQIVKAAGANPQGLMQFCAAFSTPDDAAKLGGLFDGAALGSKPAALGEMLAVGFGGADDMAGAAGKLKALAADVGNVDGLRNNLKAILIGAEGGLGDQPAVLGQLFATGCDKDPAKVKTMILGLGGTGLNNLQALVKDGGFAPQKGKGDQDKDVDVVKADCLAQVFKVGCGGKPEQFNAFCTGLSEASSRANLGALLTEGGMGTKPEVLGNLIAGCGDKVGEFGKVADAYKDTESRTKLRDLVADCGFNDNLACLGKLLGTGFGGADDPGVAAAKLQTFTTDVLGQAEARDKVKTLLAKDGLGGQPEVFGQLFAAGCEKDPAKVKGLLAGLDKDGVLNVNALVKDGGFARKTEKGANEQEVEVVKADALAQVLKVGCGGKPEVFNTFCKGFADEQGRKNLGSLLIEGGMGAAPGVLGHLITGCGDKVGEFAKVANSYQTTESRTNLKTLVSDCGFNDNAACLATVLGTGFGGADDPAAAAAKLQTFTTDVLGAVETKDKVKTLVAAKDGLGGQPEVLGQLLSTGCGKDPAKVKGLLAGLDNEGLTNLNSLVKDGGFARKTEKGANEQEVEVVKADALAQVLKVGCGGKPDVFNTFCKGFSSEPTRKNLGALLTEGGLGATPEVLGHLITGCGDKVGEFAKVADAYQDTASRTKLKTLVKDCGFDTNPACLGKTLGTGFGASYNPAAAKSAAESAAITAGVTGDVAEAAAEAAAVGLHADVAGATTAGRGKGASNDVVDVAVKAAARAVAEAVAKGLPADKVKVLAKEAARAKVLGAGLAANIAEQVSQAVANAMPRPAPADANALKAAAKTAAKARALAAGQDANSAETAATTASNAVADVIAADVGSAATKLQQFTDNVLAAPAAKNRVKALLAADGLGSQPEVFGQLLGTGCDKNPAKVQALLEKLDDQGVASLNALMKTGGLAPATAPGPGNVDVDVVKADCLAQVLKVGCNGKPEQFDAFCKGYTTDPQRQKLGALLTEGGLGAAPEVLGQLVVGCGDRSGEFFEVTNAYDSTPKRANLKRLVNECGFAEKPACLGKALGTGFGGAYNLAASKSAAETAARATGVAENIADAGAEAAAQAVYADLAAAKTAAQGKGATPAAEAAAVKAAARAVADAVGKGLTPDQVKALAKDQAKAKAIAAGAAPNVAETVAQAVASAAYRASPADANAIKAAAKAAAKAKALLAGQDNATADATANTVANAVAAVVVANPGPAAVKLQTFTANALTDAGTVNQMKQLIGTEGGFGDKPEVLGQLLGTGCDKDATKTKALLDKLGEGGGLGTRNLLALVKDGGFGPRKLADAKNTEVKADCLAQVLKVGCEGKPERFNALTASFATEQQRKGLGKLLEEGGLGTNPEVLGHLVLGCGDKPQEFVKVSDAYDTQDKRTKLTGLVTDCGFAEKPACLGKALGTGFGAKHDEAAAKSTASKAAIAKIAETAVTNQARANARAAFGGVAARNGVVDLTITETIAKPEVVYEIAEAAANAAAKAVTAGGNPRTAAKNAALPIAQRLAREKASKMVLQAPLNQVVALSNNPALTQSMADAIAEQMAEAAAIAAEDVVPVNATKAAEKLQTLAADAETDALQSTMNEILTADDGLGDQAEVFGELVGAGCRKDPAKAKELLNVLKGDVNCRKNLTSLVKEGGFAALGTVVAPEVKPDCLGQLFAIGCGGDATKFKDLCNGLTNDDRTHLQGVMRKGGLGKEPEAVGHLYKTGCRESHLDLHKLCDEFTTETNQTKFKELLEQGGLSGKGSGPQRPETLGEILGQGFRTNGGVLEPGKLKDLHTAFHPQMGDLQEIVDAFNFTGTDKGIAGKPGKRVETLMRHYGRDVSKLKTKFFTHLNGQSSGGGAQFQAYTTGAPPLTKKELMANAATFEKVGLGGVAAPVRPPDVTHTGMSHFCTRHTRKYQTLGPPDVSDHRPKDTTMWPEGTEPADISRAVEQADQIITAQNWGARKYHCAPHVLEYKGAGNQISSNWMYELHSTWQTTQKTLPNGTQVQLGFNYDVGANDISNDMFTPTDNRLTKINHGDMKAIANSLRP